jgi:hypothetical protein
MKINKICGAILSLSGLSVIVCFVGWMPALGVFLCLWGNNMEQS